MNNLVYAILKDILKELQEMNKKLDMVAEWKEWDKQHHLEEVETKRLMQLIVKTNVPEGDKKELRKEGVSV